VGAGATRYKRAGAVRQLLAVFFCSSHRLGGGGHPLQTGGGGHFIFLFSDFLVFALARVRGLGFFFSRWATTPSTAAVQAFLATMLGPAWAAVRC